MPLAQTPCLYTGQYGVLTRPGNGIEQVILAPLHEPNIQGPKSDGLDELKSTSPYEQAGTPKARALSKEHFLSNTPAVHIQDPAIRDALGIDRPPTPIPKMQTTPERQPSYPNYSNQQLEAAYLLSPKLPVPDPSDPIFSSTATPSPRFDLEDEFFDDDDCSDNESISSSDLEELAAAMSLNGSNPGKDIVPTDPNRAILRNNPEIAATHISMIFEEMTMADHETVMFMLESHRRERRADGPHVPILSGISDQFDIYRSVALLAANSEIVTTGAIGASHRLREALNLSARESIRRLRAVLDLLLSSSGPDGLSIADIVAQDPALEAEVRAAVEGDFSATLAAIAAASATGGVHPAAIERMNAAADRTAALLLVLAARLGRGNGSGSGSQM